MTRRWPGVLLLVGGVQMAGMWPLFTRLHGPTSFNEDRAFLGRDALFWGAMMEGASSVLLGLGLALLAPALWRSSRVVARAGYVFVLVSLLVPGAVDVVILATVPRLLYPAEALGLVLMAWGGSPLPVVARVALSLMGVLLLATMWSVFVSLEDWDAVGGYRIYAMLANVLAGVGWVVVGATLLRGRSPVAGSA